MNTQEATEIVKASGIPGAPVLVEKTSGWPDMARELSISNDEENEFAAEMLKGIRELRVEVEKTFGEPIALQYKAHRAMCDARKRVDSPLDEAERIIKAKMVSFQREAARLREQERLRLEAEARREEEERTLQEAVALEEAGDSDAAEKLLAEPVATPLVFAPPPPKVAGISAREKWTYRITDASLIPREYLAPDTVKIGQHVRAHKGTTNIPGVEVYDEGTIAVGGRR